MMDADAYPLAVIYPEPFGGYGKSYYCHTNGHDKCSGEKCECECHGVKR